ncbi:MAG TPA: YIP1 family protein [Bacteroidales bacterium]|nr:YIP1 family protein [Bacteroidales bacterium]
MDKIISTAKQFIVSPKSEWEVVKEDEDTAHQHVMKYVLPLALISAVAIFIGVGLIGYRVLGYRVQSVSGGLAQAIMSLASILIGVYLSGFVIHKLAPTFDTTVSLDKAVKLVGFSYTAILLAGILNIFPPLAFLTFLGGLYSLYILYIGFKPMTNVSDEKSTSYFIVSLLVIVGVYVIIGVVLAGIIGVLGFTALGGF